MLKSFDAIELYNLGGSSRYHRWDKLEDGRLEKKVLDAPAITDFGHASYKD